jgi:hypothetical protein
LIATLCTTAASSQTSESGVEASLSNSSSPVAFVYLSNEIGSSSTYEVTGFAAAANGKLSAIPGSPFSANLQNTAVNGKYLFGVTPNSVYIDSYKIEPDGALSFDKATNLAKYNACGESIGLGFDHSGSTLYNLELEGDCANNLYESFSVNESTGALNHVQNFDGSPGFQQNLVFSGNNVYGYGVSCYHDDFGFFGFKRNSNGSLTALNINPALPAAKANDAYCPLVVAADPANHLAFGFQAYTDLPYGPTVGAPQLGTYTIGSSGNITTTSTYKNMPAVSTGTIIDINMSPSGKLLAVGGSKGLQVFHFNGASPLTHFTGLLTSEDIEQVGWDNSNHLYALSVTHGKLFVFTVTPSSVSQAPGSPYTVHRPWGFIIQPKP